MLNYNHGAESMMESFGLEPKEIVSFYEFLAKKRKEKGDASASEIAETLEKYFDFQKESSRVMFRIIIMLWLDETVDNMKKILSVGKLPKIVIGAMDDSEETKKKAENFVEYIEDNIRAYCKEHEIDVRTITKEKMEFKI